MDDTVEIPIGRGLSAIIDKADLPLVEGYSWHSNAKSYTIYAMAWIPGAKPKRKIGMHTLITGAARVDHKDGNGLKNTRDNLRPCTQQQNMRNTRKRPSSGSRFKGVTFQRDRATYVRPWLAQIKCGKKKNLGRYATEEEAARAYDRAALELFGEFARVNFPGEVAA